MDWLTQMTKGSEFPWLTDNYVWQDDAACAFSPPELFEVVRDDDSLSAIEIKELNASNLEKAKAICDTCPVWHLCYSSASDEDSFHTVRAGLVSEKPPKGFSLHGNLREDECGFGHTDWALDSKGYNFCRTCKRERDRTYNGKRERSGGAPGRPAQEVCKRGHSSWGTYSNNRRYCKTCKKIRRRGLDPDKVAA